MCNKSNFISLSFVSGSQNICSIHLLGSFAMWGLWTYPIMCSRKISIDRKSRVHSRFFWSSSSNQLRFDRDGTEAGAKVDPAYDLRWDIHGTGAKGSADLKLRSKGCNPNMDLELTPPHDLRWDIDGTGARDEVDPKLRSKCCNPNMDLELTPHMI